eukprot:CAMPEP_0179476084 /NCGR_PEP_ID=MMETSP0799-20121207/55154_1 /TAXON_ID=46947 /ORGANISM="Geminigera cryophila, Strain CCMP2564" /LENGTH=125 /DNA_ID=CAMNT_0021286021 /DNA_START=60 /DNA_END=433 /DNA_ORIENTATION=-
MECGCPHDAHFLFFLKCGFGFMARRLDRVWLRNRILHAARAFAEQGIMGAELRDVPGKFSFRDTREFVWDPPRHDSASNMLMECPVLPGLYVYRNLLSNTQTRSIADMAERVCGSSMGSNAGADT